MKLKKILSILLMAVMVLTLAACGSKTQKEETDAQPTEKSQEQDTAKKSDDKETKKEAEKVKSVTISYVIPSSWANHDGMKKTIANYEAKTGNKIDVQGIPDEQYNGVVASRLGTGEGMDIFFGDYKLFDVEKILVEISGEDFVSRLDETGNNALKVNGKYYSFPTASPIASWGVFYNKEIFSSLGIEVPKNLEELNQVAAKIKESGVLPFAFAGKDGWTLLQHRNAVNGLVTISDKDVWSKLNANKVSWKDLPEYQNHYKAVELWAKEGYIGERALTTTYEQSQELLGTGKAAMLIQGSWVTSSLLSTYPDMHLGYFPLPSASGKVSIPVGTSNAAHIDKASKVIEEAKDFLRFMIEKEQVEIYLAEQPGISGFNDVDLGDALPEALKSIQSVVAAGDTSVHGDAVYVVPSPEQEMIAAYQELIVGRITADEFIDQIESAIMSNAATAGIEGF